jgi:50S ribosomal protein L16 3-hydroxylase
MFGSITEDVFLNEYWRRKPVLLKGGASHVLASAYTDEAFERCVRVLSAEGAGGIHTRPGELTFAENVSRADPGLQRIAARFATTFGVPTGWFDGVQTFGQSGIGAHFDHSDNFVLQQHGVKSWTLAPPDTLPRRDLAQRMFNVQGVGPAAMPDESSLEFELHPGDLLYIPLFWAHRGVAHGPSLSLSLVCPAVPAHASLLGAVRDVMRERLIGHQPVPSLPALSTASERERHRRKLKAAAQLLLKELARDEIIERIVDKQMGQRPAPGAAE